MSPKHFIIRKQDVEEVMKRTGLKETVSRTRLQKFKRGEITEKELFKPSRYSSSAKDSSQIEESTVDENENAQKVDKKLSKFAETKRVKNKSRKRTKSVETYFVYEPDLPPDEALMKARQEFSNKNEFGKRGPLLPLYETVKKEFIRRMDEYQTIPSSPGIVEASKGSPRVCMKHYNRIRAELVAELFKLRESAKELLAENKTLKEENEKLKEQLSKVQMNEQFSDETSLSAENSVFDRVLQKTQSSEAFNVLTDGNFDAISTVLGVLQKAKEIAPNDPQNQFAAVAEDVQKKMLKCIHALDEISKIFGGSNKLSFNQMRESAQNASNFVEETLKKPSAKTESLDQINERDARLNEIQKKLETHGELSEDDEKFLADAAHRKPHSV